MRTWSVCTYLQTGWFCFHARPSRRLIDSRLPSVIGLQEPARFSVLTGYDKLACPTSPYKPPTGVPRGPPAATSPPPPTGKIRIPESAERGGPSQGKVVTRTFCVCVCVCGRQHSRVDHICSLSRAMALKEEATSPNDPVHTHGWRQIHFRSDPGN